MSLKDVLASPRLYQTFQEAGGFFGARLKAIRDYVAIRPGARIIDVGCGPGFLAQHLPKGVNYIGFDIDEAYIAYARQNFGHLGTFHCRIFDDAAAAEFGPADIVMMNGVVHHLDDATALTVFATIRKALAPGGLLFTLDGCFRDGQNPLAAWLLRSDRGEFVRTEPGYRALLGQVFEDVTIHLREDISRVPYSFAIGLAKAA
jgi:SAM-dependent methyltransferase